MEPRPRLRFIDEKIRANTAAVLDEVQRTGVLPRTAAVSLAAGRSVERCELGDGMNSGMNCAESTFADLNLAITITRFFHGRWRRQWQMYPLMNKAPPAQTTLPDVWQSFRGDMDRLFDRFGSGFGFPSLRRMFDVEPTLRSSFSFSTPAIDMSEDEKAYKISAELPGIDAKDIDVSVSGTCSSSKAKNVRRRRKRTRTIIFPSAPMARFSGPSSCRPASIATRTPPISRREC